jgi:DNA-binding Lrp family transcriptional regulator
MLKLDLKDKKILAILDINARTPLSKIASEVGLSKQVVDYRIKRLIEKEVITGFTIRCDLTKLGYSSFGVYIRMRNVTEKREEEIIQLIVKHPFSKWVVVCEGRWDLAFALAAKNMIDFESMLEEIIAAIGDNVEKYEISSIFTIHEFYLSILERKEPRTCKPPRNESAKEQELEKIDSTDMLIMNELQLNSRANPVAIATKLKISADMVRYRIKNLVSRKIILDYHTQINFKALGSYWYQLIIDVQGCSATHEKEILNKIKTTPHLSYAVRCMGAWDLELHLQAESNEEFRKIVMKVREQIGNFIHTHDTILIFGKYKSKSIPEGVIHEFTTQKTKAKTNQKKPTS